ncbi:MAG: rod shape-determining protein MreD [Bacillota bacterium]
MFYGIFFLAVFVLIILQATLFAIFGLKPDLVLVAVVAMALLKGSDHGAGWGFSLGLLEDLFNDGRFMGVNTLSKMLTGLLAGYLEKNVFKDSPLVPLVCTFGFTIVNEFVSYFLLNAFRYHLAFFDALFFSILPLAFYNAIFSPIIYFAVYRLDFYFRERYLRGS